MFYTYAHYTPDGRLFYIGKGSGNRAYTFYQRGSHWNNTVAKYGEPLVKIITEWATESLAMRHEAYLIAYFRSAGYRLCNKTDGGEGTSGYKHTPEQRENNRRARLGKSPSNKGVPCSEEVKAKISAAKMGKSNGPMSEEAKRKIGYANRGKKHSEETRRKCGAANIGRPSSDKQKAIATVLMKGNTYSVGNTNNRKWRWVGKHMETGEMIEFIGSEALNAAGFQHANVIKCINGARKSHKGYIWVKEPLEAV